MQRNGQRHTDDDDEDPYEEQHASIVTSPRTLPTPIRCDRSAHSSIDHIHPLSGCGHQAKAGLDLVHEAVHLEAQSYDVDAQNSLPRQRHGVLPQIVLRRIQAEPVMRAVDLHDQTMVVPADVEVDAARGP